jgi:16S rRNA (cytosine967-C5)-methyltransferase
VAEVGGEGAGAANGGGAVSGAREAALLSLHAVERRGDHADVALHFFLRRQALDRRDSALATELAYGALKRRNTLDWIIESRADRGVAAMTAWIRNILRLGVYQLRFLRVPAHAAVNESVALAKKYGHAGTARYVNAVLRAVARAPDEPAPPPPAQDPVGFLVFDRSHPEWLVRRWVERYGFDGARGLCDWDNQPAPVVVRPNRLRVTPGELLAALAAEGVAARPAGTLPPDCGGLAIEPGGAVEDLQAYKRGLFQVQDEGAMLAGLLLAPQPGETVVDACGAPGGKATHLAELMGDRGRVVALDRDEYKLPAVRGSSRRLGIHIVSTQCGDARELGELLPDAADRVLCDVPCSGVGALRRNADARWRKVPADLPRLARLQLAILAGASGAVRRGGVLLYATCSLEPEENEEVVAAFLDAHPEFLRDDLRPLLPPALAAEPAAGGGTLQLLPHVHGCDGFFYARLRRR